MTLRGRLRTALRRPAAPLTPQERWGSFQEEVEPALAGTPRVHRFARPPVLGDAGTAAAPLAVWIDESDPAATRDALEATLRSLATGTVAAADILHGPLDQALGMSRAERVVLLRAGDVLAPLALERLGQAATLASDAAVLTCDEDRLDAAGTRGVPRVRPGPSPDRWLALDDSGALLVVAREPAIAAARSLAGWPELDGRRHALALALARSGGEGHAHVPLFLAHVGSGARLREPPLRAEAVARQLDAWGKPGRVEPAGTAAAPVRWVRRPLGLEPSVEIVICFRDRAPLLQRCIDSLRAVGGYERLSLALVDNGSVEPETAALLDRLREDPGVRVLRDERPFNFAALNNLAARTSRADVLVFLNNDTEAIDGGWILALLEEAVRPEVGAVAPLLLYPDGTVQHAGAALGLHGYAGHPFAGLRPAAETPFGRPAEGTRNWLAVTAACMMVERVKFEQVGGFDESFIVAGNDVDLCLRLTAAGFRSLCVPQATMIHDESRSRGAYIDPRDFVTSERSYGAFRTVGDPFYSPNLTLDSTDCAIRIPARESP